MPCFTQVVRLFSVIALIICGNVFANQDKLPVLTLYNWSEYIDESLLTSFEERHGIKVKQVFYETDELKDEYLLSTNGGEGLDLIIGSDTSFKTYIKHGWIAALDKTLIPNITHIDPRWTNATAQLSPYSIPYLWGTVGIAYRNDKILAPISSWLSLYRPAPELKGKIMMIDDSRDTLGLALKALGYSINSTNTNELAAAEKLLKAQRPSVSNYSYINLSEKSSLISGKTWITMVYNGDGLTLEELTPNITFVVPEEGTNFWVDHIAVLEKSQQKALAYKFINFINDPINAAQLATSLNFASPNTSAIHHLDKAFLKNKAIYPEQSIVDKSESYKEFSPREQKKRNEVYLRSVE